MLHGCLLRGLGGPRHQLAAARRYGSPEWVFTRTRSSVRDSTELTPFPSLVATSAQPPVIDPALGDVV